MPRRRCVCFRIGTEHDRLQHPGLVVGLKKVPNNGEDGNPREQSFYDWEHLSAPENSKKSTFFLLTYRTSGPHREFVA